MMKELSELDQNLVKYSPILMSAQIDRDNIKKAIKDWFEQNRYKPNDLDELNAFEEYFNELIDKFIKELNLP